MWSHKERDDRNPYRNSLTPLEIHLQKEGCDFRIGSPVFRAGRVRVHRTVINRFKNYYFSIRMGVASGFQGLDSPLEELLETRRRKSGGCENGRR